MTNWSRLAMTSAIALALATPAFAQSTTPSPTTDPSSPPTQAAPTEPAPSTGASTTTSAGGTLTVQEDGQVLSSDLLGMKLVGPDGASIGEVADLILDDQNKIVGAVLSVGGLLGLGAKDVGVAWDALDVQETDGSAVAMINMSKEELAEMPKYKTLVDIKVEQQQKMSTPAPTTGTLPKQ